MLTFEAMFSYVSIGLDIVDLGRVITKINFRDVNISGSSSYNLIIRMNPLVMNLVLMSLQIINVDGTTPTWAFYATSTT